MRIVCDSCGAKYSIADEKIRGKLFKVRCKKCSNMIMVDGTALDVQAAPQASEAVWYVVIDGAQTGPMSDVEVADQIANGAVDAETFAWQEGMGDWLRLADIPDFAGYFGHNGSVSAEQVGPMVELAAPPQPEPVPAAPAPDPQSWGVAVPAAAEREPAAPRATAALLSHAAPAPASTAEFFSAPPPVDRDGGRTAGPDERGENSVLFSLSDLASKKKEKKDDLPRTEGSGLIDIRVLAGSAAVAPGPGSVPAGGPATAAVPMVAAMPLPPRRSNTGLYIAVSAVLLLALAGFAVLFVTMREPAAPPVAALPSGGTPPGAGEPVAAAAPPAQDAAQPPAAEPAGEAVGSQPPAAEPEGSAQQAPAGDAVAVAEAPPESPSARERDARREGEPGSRSRTEGSDAAPSPAPAASPAAPAAAGAPSPSAAPAAPAAGGRERSASSVDGALASIRARQGGGSEAPPAPAASAPTPAPAPAAAEPQGLTREAIQATIQRYRSRVAGCGSAGAGTFRVRFVVQPSGSVTNVQSEDSSDTGQCIANVVRDMQFPSFSGAAAPVTYPFRL